MIVSSLLVKIQAILYYIIPTLTECSSRHQGECFKFTPSTGYTLLHYSTECSRRHQGECFKFTPSTGYILLYYSTE